MGSMEIPPKGEAGKTAKGLSSEKREDLWSILLAVVVLLLSMAAPEAVREFFTDVLYVF